MSIFEYDEELHMKQVKEEGRQEGIAVGRQEGEMKSKIKLIKKKMDKGLEIPMICEHLEEPIDFVEKVCRLVKENPSADVDAICKML